MFAAAPRLAFDQTAGTTAQLHGHPKLTVLGKQGKGAVSSHTRCSFSQVSALETVRLPFSEKGIGSVCVKRSTLEERLDLIPDASLVFTLPRLCDGLLCGPP